VICQPLASRPTWHVGTSVYTKFWEASFSKYKKWFQNLQIGGHVTLKIIRNFTVGVDRIWLPIRFHRILYRFRYIDPNELLVESNKFAHFTCIWPSSEGVPIGISRCYRPCRIARYLLTYRLSYFYLIVVLNCLCACHIQARENLEKVPSSNRWSEF